MGAIDGWLRAVFSAAGTLYWMGRVDESTIFYAVDLLPTLASLAGARVPPEANVDGQNR